MYKISAFDFFQHATFLLIYSIAFGNLCVCAHMCAGVCVPVRACSGQKRAVGCPPLSFSAFFFWKRPLSEPKVHVLSP